MLLCLRFQRIRGHLLSQGDNVAIQASAQQQAALLELQQHDTALLQCAHKRAIVPEIALIADLEVKLSALELKLVAIKTEISDLSLNQAKADNDVQQVVGRAKKDQERIDSGAITSAKEIEALQHEIGSLAKRQAELEDIELGIMMQLDDAKSVQNELEHEKSAVVQQIEANVAVRDETLAQIDAQARELTVQREAVAITIDAELLNLYDKVRSDLGGVGAALLHRGSCQGCHIALDATEIDRIRHLPAESVVRCEECRRILVRTAESGL